MNILKLYQEKIKQEKIKNFDLEKHFGKIDKYADYNHKLSFRERQHYTYDPGYKVKYHFGETFNRIICVEYNKPKESEISKLKAKLNGNYSKKNIYENSTYNQRKHLNYIYIKLNDLELPTFDQGELHKQKEIISYYLHRFMIDKGIHGKTPEYRLIIDVICEHFGYDKIRELLFFKERKDHREYIKKILKLE